MARIGNLDYPAKPPRYWIEAKQRDGITAAGAGRIWWKNYTDAKRLTAWLAAPESEWLEHGHKRPS